MGNLEVNKITLSYEPDEFYALQSIIEQWYAEHHLDESRYIQLKNKVANEIRHIDTSMLDGTLTIN